MENNKTIQQQIQCLYNLLDAWEDAKGFLSDDYHNLILDTHNKIEQLIELEDHLKMLEKFKGGN